MFDFEVPNTIYVYVCYLSILAIWLILAHVIKGQKLLEQLRFSRVHQEKLNREKAIN